MEVNEGVCAGENTGCSLRGPGLGPCPTRRIPAWWRSTSTNTTACCRIRLHRGEGLQSLLTAQLALQELVCLVADLPAGVTRLLDRGPEMHAAPEAAHAALLLEVRERLPR